MLRNVGGAMLAICSSDEERILGYRKEIELDERKNYHP
jgi:hypothetical protein